MDDLDRHLPGIVAGDPEAFAAWVAGVEHRLRLSLRSYATRVDVEAVVQETLLRAWQVAGRIERHPRGDSLARVAIRIARNLAIDEVRRARLAPVEAPALEVVLEEHCGPGRDATPDPHLRQAIEDCREDLPKKPAQALEVRLTAAGQRSDHELAATLGVKTNTFLQNFGRARRMLADCLEGKGIRLDLEMV